MPFRRSSLVPGHLGQAYLLTSSEALSDDDIATRLADVLGRTITYVQVPWEAVRESVAGRGLPEWGLDGVKARLDFWVPLAAAVLRHDRRHLGGPGPAHGTGACRRECGRGAAAWAAPWRAPPGPQVLRRGEAILAARRRLGFESVSAVLTGSSATGAEAWRPAEPATGGGDGHG